MPTEFTWCRLSTIMFQYFRAETPIFLYTRIVFVNTLVQNGSWFQAQNDPACRALIMRNFQQHIRNDKNKIEKRESFET